MDDQLMEKLARSLTGETVDIVPFIPYLLQDLWELGSSPDEILNLIKNNLHLPASARVLDLGCGKGAVSITLAKELKYHFKGIDLMPDFIEYAKLKAEEYEVFNLCEFKTGDIVSAVKDESGYDLVIYGAVGDILGNQTETLQKLAQTVKPGGYIIIDDAYLPEKNTRELRFSYDYPTLTEWKSYIEETGLELITFHIADSANPNNSRDFSNISRRSEELIKAYPSKRKLLERYIQSQKSEYDDLEDSLIGVVFLIKNYR